MTDFEPVDLGARFEGPRDETLPLSDEERQHLLKGAPYGAGSKRYFNGSAAGIVAAIKRGSRRRWDTTVASAGPPAAAEFLLYVFARTKTQQALVGDLAEKFDRNSAELGHKRAARLYWAETIRSLWPLFVRMLGRFVKWAAIADVIKRHFFS